MRTNLISSLLLLVLFFNSNLSAQININFNSINEFVFNTKEALNISVINSNSGSIQLNFNGSIVQSNGQKVVEFSTFPVMVNSGANVFNSMTLGFEQMNYFNSDIAEIEQKTGTYPSGQYRICIWSVCVENDCNGFGENAGRVEIPICIQVNVENPTPLLLSYPNDKSEIEETRPVYSWIPPSPLAGIGGLNYNMTLVEIFDGQSKSDALAMNRPIIELVGHSATTFIHPLDLLALDSGKSYAWQVQAFVGNTYVATSEQWEFKIKKHKGPPTYRYYDLNRNFTEIVKLKQDEKLFFTINNQLGHSEPKIEIRELHSNLVNPKIQKVVKDSIDSKFDVYSSDLSGSGPLKYMVELDYKLFNVNLVYEMVVYFNNRKSILRFEIIK